jgi:hypothetical protein
VDAASHPEFSVSSSKLLSTLSPHRLTIITDEKMHQCPPHSIKDSNLTPTATRGTSPACQYPAHSFPPLDQRCSAHSHLLQYFALTIIWACTGTCTLPAPSYLRHTIAPACPQWCSDCSQLPMHTCHPLHLPRLPSPTPPLNHNDNSNTQTLTTSTCGIAQEILEGDFTNVSGKLIYYIYSFQLT